MGEDQTTALHTACKLQYNTFSTLSTAICGPVPLSIRELVLTCGPSLVLLHGLVSVDLVFIETCIAIVICTYSNYTLI